MPVPNMGWSSILGSCRGGVDCRASNRGAHTPQGSMTRASSPSRQLQRSTSASQSSHSNVPNLGNNNAPSRNRSSLSDESIGNGQPPSQIPQSDNQYLLAANTKDKTVHTVGPLKMQDIEHLKVLYDKKPDYIVGVYDNMRQWIHAQVCVSIANSKFAI